MALASPTKQWLLRAYRLAVFAAILALVHLVHSRRPPAAAADADLPEGAVQTSPASDDIVGYAGPTNTLVQFDGDGRITRLEILHSADTREHVDKLLAHPKFFEQFVGLTAQEVAAATGIDAVSGATLTCYAIAEGVRRRLGATGPASRFTSSPTLADVQQRFPAAAAFVSSSPHADSVLGYQGPSLVVVALGSGGDILGFYVHDTFDNKPYVDDVLAEPYFMETFNGMEPAAVAAIDVQEAGIEGVSGATLTSYALAEAVVAAMRAHTAPPPPAPPRPPVSPHEFGTAAITLFGAIIAFTKLHTRRRVRLVFQLLVVGYLGLTAGNLLAQSLLVGWTNAGVPWQVAPGLALLAAAALVLPWATKRNVYCDHLCPHGAAQQLVNRVSPFRNRSLPKKLARALEFLPGLTLFAVLVTALLALPVNYAAIEPFNAYLFTIAGPATITLAIASLVAALFTPLPYCKYACPTGAVLTFLRARGKADGFSRRDAAALGFLAIAALFLAT